MSRNQIHNKIDDDDFLLVEERNIKNTLEFKNTEFKNNNIENEENHLKDFSHIFTSSGREIQRSKYLKEE